MPINIDVLSTKVFSQYKNGATFVDNLTDFTPNLVGSVMEKIKIVSKYSVSWVYWSAAQDGTAASFALQTYYEFNGDQLSVERKDGGNFLTEDGLYQGQNVIIRAGNNYYSNKTIVTVSDSNVVIDMDGVTSFGGAIAVLAIFGDEPLTALVYNFGLIENSESFNFVSKVSDNEQGYYATEIGEDTGGGRTTSFVDMKILGQYKDWVTGSSKVRYVEQGAGQYDRGAITTAQVFEVEHELIINPFYTDGQLDDLLNNVLPTYLSGINSLKYAFQADFRTSISNPNTSITVVSDKSLGSVAWFGENFNGFNNLYNIKSVSYEDSATTNSADGLQISSKTKAIFTLERVGGAFTNGDKIGGYISYLPTVSEYTDTVTTLSDNFLYDSIFCNVGGATEVGAGIIKSASSVLVGSDAVLTLEIEYNNNQKLKLLSTDEPYYLLGIQCADNSVDSGNIDKVILKEVGNYVVAADIPDLVVGESIRLYPYEQRVGLDLGFTDMIAWNEDGFTVKAQFGLDLSKQAFLNTFEIALVAHNPNTNNYFELDNYVFDIQSQTISNNIQQININDNKGYPLVSGSQYNLAQINAGTKVGDIQNYEILFGQKISWQDWIKNKEVDTVFYDVSKDNDNLNDKASNYSNLNGYDIKIALKYNLSGVNDLGVSGITNYLTLTPPIRVWDYRTFDPNSWSSTFNLTRESNSTSVSSILSGEDTRFQVRWSTADALGTIDEYYICHRIEVLKQTGYEIYEIDTYQDIPNNNLLIPLDGETYLKTYIDSGFVYSECLINGDLIDSTTSYSISATLKREGGGVPVGAKLMETGEIKLTETGDIKIVE